MPMPMPIIVASEVDQSGASTKEMTTVVSVLLTASPATATRIGRPAATTRAERDQQDDRGGGQADALGADLALLGLHDALAAEGDLEAGARRLVGDVEHLLAVRDRHVDGVLDVEAQVRDQGACRPG